MILMSLLIPVTAFIFSLYLWAKWVEYNIGAGKAGFTVYMLAIVLTVTSVCVILIKS